MVDGAAAHAYVRPHDVLLSTVSMNGSSSPAQVTRMNDLGWISKVHLELPDGQPLVAQVPNEQLIQVRAGSNVHVDLRNAKVFPPAGAGAPSDELAGI
jgi:ABC-type sulfate/molybdate transport systems ATPase subunit